MQALEVQIFEKRCFLQIKRHFSEQLFMEHRRVAATYNSFQHFWDIRKLKSETRGFRWYLRPISGGTQDSGSMSYIRPCIWGPRPLWCIGLETEIALGTRLPAPFSGPKKQEPITWIKNEETKFQIYTPFL